MRALNRKLWRDLWHMRGQAVAIAAVIGCGIAVFNGAHSTLHSLESARQSYYERYRFAEVFSGLRRAPRSVADRAREIPGVDAVDDRIVEGVILDVPGLPEPAVGKLISLPDTGEPRLNAVHLLRGRFPEAFRTGEVLAEEAFVSAHGFEPGDRIEAVLNGRLQELTIVGVGMSPEYITTIQGGTFWPDDRRFGIFWMPRRQMEAAFEMEGAFNDLSLALSPEAAEAEVIRRLDRLLLRYGGLGANGRDLHLSHRFISDELSQLRVMSLVPPSIFLGVAVFLLNVALRRLLSLQREQIATLKAFGYDHWRIGMHFAGLVCLIVAAGSVMGSLLGLWMGRSMTTMYAGFYRFPVTLFRIDGSTLATGAGIAFFSSLLGVFFSVRRAVSIPAAEAMRPEAPPDYRPSLIERMGWHRLLSQSARMVLRELARRPAKAGLTALGIAFSCAILVVGNFGKDAVNFLIDFQFGLQERHDASLTFFEAIPARAVRSLRQIPGIDEVEVNRAVPVRLVHGQDSRQTSVTGLGERRELFRLLDAEGRKVDLPPEGLVVSVSLAEILGIRPGDSVRVEVLDFKRPVKDVRVAGIVDDFAGTAAYMDLRALHTLLGEPPVITGAWLRIEDGRENEVFRALKETPVVSGVTLQRVAVAGFMDSFADNLLRMRIFNVCFACVIAIGVVYNSARVALSERSRELATLRVIGFTRGEVSAILLGELFFLTAIAIPLGFGIGYGLCRLISAALETELYRIPLVLNPPTFVFAAVVVIAAAVVSGLLVRRGIDRLDLVAVLKSRE